ncbi:MAG: DUF1800 domain-containing protein [Polaromonas sp.]|uniref:DUF1800 domain-containing protein n=1 Tax=Polaromonas sp. TaxID=1869339 RepID=UPI00272F7150|nr:DUF1800 domain-containing protein [Polaromonas sp.]MDP1740508.1 DUF1800 domain-containing protein [Polaromonas sp.]MDP3355877.1 DUF1800 domain-containing protein [Polaromonas sp.]
MPTTAPIASLLALALAGCFTLTPWPVHAQTDGAIGGSANTAAAWRASSRLGYAPTPASAQSASADPRAWALQQVQAAYAASRRPPNIPAELSRFNAPLNDIARDFHVEREARRTRRDQPAPTAPGQAMQPAAGGDEAFSREMAQSAAAWRLMACSDPALENPLLARMTEFWFNHLNVFVGKGPVRPFVGHYVVNVIRPHALGRFEDLLLASAQHPAMLLYLDQAQSNNRGLNENYARELMELHTLGVNGGYTQSDVRELARILTGWTVNLRGGEGFRFAERLHDTGDKTLLGRTYVNQGEAEGQEAIRALARHPATARRIATRLASFFVADQPPPALVERLSKIFLSTQGDMRAMMQALVAAPEFWAAGNSLFKTPLDFACSALTAAGGVKERRDIVQTLGFLAQAGQPMHGWQTPDGYKTDAATWLAPEALTRRADFAMGVAQRMPEPVYLNAFLSPATRERIALEPLPLRTGLVLASPDFMRK